MPDVPKSFRMTGFDKLVRSAPAEIDKILARGGKPRVALLQYCVMSVQIDPVFLFLVQEYRMRPAHDAAVALHDVFCAPGAPARMCTFSIMPSLGSRLDAAVRPLREQLNQMRPPEQSEPGTGVPLTTPYRHLFDFVAHALRSNPRGDYARVGNAFDLRLTPAENLPGGKMNSAQRHFVENIWRASAKPRLFEAGFWQVADIG